MLKSGDSVATGHTGGAAACEDDFLVVGAGIVGLTLAHQLTVRAPGARVTVIDKEACAGMHASGRNSGVLHSGIYYAPGSVKAEVCVAGARRMKAFVREHDLPLRDSGKLVVATDEAEVSGLERLLANAAANGVQAQRVDAQQVAEIEPDAQTVGYAIHCPETASVDPRAIVERLVKVLESRGVRFRWGVRVHDVDLERRRALTDEGPLSFGFLFNCAGAYADRLAHACGCAREYALVPFRGGYFRLRPGAGPSVRSHVYPVPDPKLPFLGIHVSRGLGGDVNIGPTAWPALGREHYSGLHGVSGRDAALIARVLTRLYVGGAGFRRLVHAEVRNRMRRFAGRAAARMVPAIRSGMLERAPKVGIRPQLVDLQRQTLVMDYLTLGSGPALHVLNAISPAFTSSFAFADRILDGALGGAEAAAPASAVADSGGLP